MTTNEPAGSDPGTPRAAQLSPVSRTALAVARVRAYESSRPEPLFTDPYALAFIAASGTPMPTAAPAGPLAQWLVARGIMRTRFYDDRLLAAAADGGQVVVLAAGLDTRAYRLAWPPGTRLFEIDLPAVLDFKQEVLDEQGPRRAAPAPRCPPTWPIPPGRTGCWPPGSTPGGPPAGWPRGCWSTWRPTRPPDSSPPWASCRPPAAGC